MILGLIFDVKNPKKDRGWDSALFGARRSESTGTPG